MGQQGVGGTPQDIIYRFSLGNWRRARLGEIVNRWGSERFYL